MLDMKTKIIQLGTLSILRNQSKVTLLETKIKHKCNISLVGT